MQHQSPLEERLLLPIDSRAGAGRSRIRTYGVCREGSSGRTGGSSAKVCNVPQRHYKCLAFSKTLATTALRVSRVESIENRVKRDCDYSRLWLVVQGTLSRKEVSRVGENLVRLKTSRPHCAHGRSPWHRFVSGKAQLQGRASHKCRCIRLAGCTARLALGYIDVLSHSSWRGPLS